jgi:hypothetical protein
MPSWAKKRRTLGRVEKDQYVMVRRSSYMKEVAVLGWETKELGLI